MVLGRVADHTSDSASVITGRPESAQQRAAFDRGDAFAPH
jgi:hypothetical protein